MFGHIIIDGPDAVGKTTLAEFINSKFGFEVVHSDAKSKNDYEYHSNLLKCTQHKFYDRFMAGEFVYPRIYNRPAKLSISEMEKLFDEIVETNSLYIIMTTTDMSIVKQRLIDRGELDYLNEIDEQVSLFGGFAHVFEKYFDKYDNFKWVDISNPSAYDDIYNYAYNYINNNLE